jgi:hypothetical protein
MQLITGQTTQNLSSSERFGLLVPAILETLDPELRYLLVEGLSLVGKDVTQFHVGKSDEEISNLARAIGNMARWVLTGEPPHQDQ